MSEQIGERQNPPRGWHEQKNGELVCPHRDGSVCPDCVAANPEALDTYGAHFWIPLSDRPALFAAENEIIGERP